MLTILKRRYENVGVVIYPVRVQGEGASEEIATGIAVLDQQSDVDTIVVARGGGSLEDLWAFNEVIVARAVEKAKKPIVSAVGHEVDFTICDLVADVRAPTPSAAAELVVRNKADLRDRIEGLRDRQIKGMDTILKGKRLLWIAANARIRDPRRRLVDLRLRGDDLVVRLAAGVRRILEARSTGLGNARRNLFYRAPFSRVNRSRDCLGQRRENLEGAMNDLLKLKRRSLERSIDRLEAMSPLNILRRGYSIVRRVPLMEIVRDSRHVKRGDRVDVKLHQGRLVCNVEKTKTNGSQRSGETKRD